MEMIIIYLLYRQIIKKSLIMEKKIMSIYEEGKNIEQELEAEGKIKKPAKIDVFRKVLDTFETWHDGDKCFITHQGNYQLGSDSADSIIRNILSQQCKAVVSKSMLTDLNGYLCAKAKHESPAHKSYHRVARIDDKIFIDIGSADWSVIEVTSSGWQILQTSPVKFVRTPTTGQIAIPSNKDIAKPEELLTVFNVVETQLPLLIGIMLDAWKGQGGYYVGLVYGEHGTGKSEFCKHLISVVDPQVIEGLNSPPTDPQQVSVISKSCHCVGYDNVSYLSQAVSDALCRCSTGGVNRGRQYHTNSDLHIFANMNPQYLNGIVCFAKRPDLLDRCILFNLKPFDVKLTLTALKKRLKTLTPRIVGMLLEYLVKGLSTTPDDTCSYRMAESVNWSLGCQIDGFENEYADNVKRIAEETIDNDDFTTTLMTYINLQKLPKEISKSDLYELSKSFYGGNILNNESPYKNLYRFRNELKRVLPLLRKVGIDITEIGKHPVSRQFMIRIEDSKSKHAKHEANDVSVVSPLKNRVVETCETCETRISLFEKIEEEKGDRHNDYTKALFDVSDVSDVSKYHENRGENNVTSREPCFDDVSEPRQTVIKRVTKTNAGHEVQVVVIPFDIYQTLPVLISSTLKSLGGDVYQYDKRLNGLLRIIQE